MKKMFAVLTLALALVAVASAQTIADPNGATTFTRVGSSVRVSNVSNATQDVRFVQPGGFFANLILSAGDTVTVSSSNDAYYEWTCPAPYNVVIPGTVNSPDYSNHGQTMNCR